MDIAGSGGYQSRMIRATKSYFQGTWLLVRIIEKEPEGIIGEVWGEAEFAEDGEGLTCR